MTLEAKWRVLIVVCTGIFMATLDGSILNIASPSIAEYMNVSMHEVQWIVTSYMLVITSSLLFLGKMGDKVGSQKIYALGFLVFTIGSFLCSISNTLPLLISSRVFQGIGASMLMATGIGIVSNTFPPGERGKALGLTGSMVGIGNMTGPSLGGLLVANFSWPIIFLINIPIGLIGYFLARKYLSNQPARNSVSGYDPGGILLFALSTVIIVVSVSAFQYINLYLLSLGIIFFVLFHLYEKKQANPMLDLSLFKIRKFTNGNILAFAGYTANTFVMFLMPFYMERLLHFSPAYSGLLMTILPVSMAVTAPLAGSLSDKIGSSRLVSIAFVLMTGAFITLSTLNQEANIYKIAGGLFLLGIGMGTLNSPNNSSILGSVPRDKAGYTGGFISTVRNFSFSIGIASSVSIFTLLLNKNLKILDYNLAYVSANRIVFYIAAGITLFGLVFSLIENSREENTNKPSFDLA